MVGELGTLVVDGELIELDPGDGLTYRYECRDRKLPFSAAADVLKKMGW